VKLAEPPIDVIAKGAFPSSAIWHQACKDVEEAVAEVDWPPGTGSFLLNPAPGRRRDGSKDTYPNGVAPMKVPAIRHLESRGWRTEALPPLPSTVLRTGDLDALYDASGTYVAFEWETGNISSSHRAMNKLVLGLIQGAVRGGFLVVLANSMRSYLTDRIGNIGELRPYLPLWSAATVPDAALRIYVAEHDALSDQVPHIPKGTDGRALY